MARNKYDVDEELQATFNLEQLKRLFHYMAPYKDKIFSCMFFMVISSILSLLIPYLTTVAIDKCIPGKDIVGLFLIAGAIIIILVFIAVIMRGRMITMGKVGQSIIVDLRKDLFVHLQTLPFSYYDNRPHGKILVRVVNYVNALSDVLTNGFVNLVADIVTLIVAIIFMLCLDVRLTLVSFIGLPILFTVIFTLKNAQRRVFQRLSIKQSNMNAYVHESINGMRVTQAFAREEKNKDIYKEVCSDYRKAWMNMIYINHLIWPSIDIISVLSVCLIYFFAVYVLGNTITVGVLVGFVGYLWRFWAPIMNIGNLYNNLVNAMAYLERIFETLAEKPIVCDSPNAKEMPLIKGDIQFEKVTFMYEKDKVILNALDLDVKQGESIAIVGPTGAGKTTIVNLLSRFYNIDAGRILIDGIDITQVTLQSLRKQMGIMLQDSFIFSGDIMENIRYGKLDATDEEVIAAAKVVRAHDFIKEMPEAYHTKVNERGSGLSVGQRQLISFARALLADPKILILDEATSSIDTQTEVLLQEGLERLLKGRTSFVIAHRLSTIKNASRILYIDQGTILESGTHEELMARKGYYYELHEAQYSVLNAI